LFILGNIFNLNVSALLAGAGIAGLAIALAAKESLENLFASFIIFLERPFVIEDYVIVSGVEGLVEKVGFRSTRLRTSEKTFVTIPNRQMINNPVDNLSLRTMRRVGFDLGLSYTTSVEQMIQIVSEIKLFLEDYTKDAGNVNVTFSEFGPSALNLYVQYYLKVATWPLYMEKKQEVNFEIMKIVRKNGVSFASTKPTVVINQNA
jgi:MscS family membrane protein